MATTFTKIGNNVLIKMGDSDPISAPGCSFIKPDPRNDGVIVISEDADPQEENDGIRIFVSDVTSPVVTDREDLITKLSTDYFKGDVVSGPLTNAQLIAALATLFPSGKPVKLTLQFNRPDLNTDYAANDAVGPVTTNAAALPFVGDAALTLGGGGTANLLKLEVPAVFAGKTITCYLYNELPTSLVGDNVPFVLDTANRLKRVAKVSVLIDAVENSSTIAWGQQEILIPYQCIAGSKTLYAAFKVGEVVVAPTAQGLFTVALMTTLQS